MKRRIFIKCALAAAAIAMPALRLLGRRTPERVVEAIRSCEYPGPVMGSDPVPIARNSHWAG